MAARPGSWVRGSGWILDRPPIPHEHGAWVILYAPLVLGFCAAHTVNPVLWLVLTLAVTGLFLAREAAGLLLRRRGKVGSSIWLCAYSAIFLSGALPLLLHFRA